MTHYRDTTRRHPGIRRVVHAALDALAADHPTRPAHEAVTLVIHGRDGRGLVGTAEECVDEQGDPSWGVAALSPLGAALLKLYRPQKGAQ